MTPKSHARPEEIASALEAFIQRETGAESVRVENLRRLTGGASRETWAFDAVLPHPPAPSPTSGEGEAQARVGGAHGAEPHPVSAATLRPAPSPTSREGEAQARVSGARGGEPHPVSAATLRPAPSPSSGEGEAQARVGGAPGEARLPLILQRDVRGQPREMTRALEFRLIRAAYEAGAMAPEPMWLGDGSLGGEFYIVRRIEGENVPRRLLRDEQYAGARAALPRQLGAVLAKIHAIPLDGLAELPRPAPTPSVAEQALDKHEQLLRAIAPEPHPAFELAIRWLRARLPHPPSPSPSSGEGEAQVRARGAQGSEDGVERRTLVHGDFRVGNVLFGPEGLRAVLDWEIAHVGDPMEDLSWVCVRSWRFGGDKPVGGVGTREEFFAAYEAAGGAKVDPARVRWWEIFGNLRWGIICISQAKVYLDGISNSLELAAIGRRTAETEWELLELMEGTQG